jgi:hypothetical protein
MVKGRSMERLAQRVASVVSCQAGQVEGSDGEITAAIWASQTTIPHGPPELRQAARRTTASAGNKEAAAQRHAEDGPLPALVSEIAT